MKKKFKVIYSTWFTNFIATIGIVVCEDRLTKERKAYISPIGGLHKGVDEKFVCNAGARVTIEQLEDILIALKKGK